MRQFGNRLFYDTLEELVDPDRAALLVINMQNDQCSPGGRYDKRKIDISMHRGIIPSIKALVEKARAAKVMVVYLQHTIVPGFIEDSPSLLSLHVPLGADPNKILEFHNVEGTWGHQVIDELKPQESDFSVRYNRADPWIASKLEQLLRSYRRESLILCGNETQGVVESVSRGGSNRDFYRVMVKDCIASTNIDYHEFMLRLMRERLPALPVVESTKITEIWSSHAPG